MPWFVLLLTEIFVFFIKKSLIQQWMSIYRLMNEEKALYGPYSLIIHDIGRWHHISHDAQLKLLFSTEVRRHEIFPQALMAANLPFFPQNNPQLSVIQRDWKCWVIKYLPPYSTNSQPIRTNPDLRDYLTFQSILILYDWKNYRLV